MRGFIVILATLAILLAPSAAADTTTADATGPPCVKQTSHSTSVNSSSCLSAAKNLVNEITKPFGLNSPA